MPNIPLTLAIGDYDHVSDLMCGRVPVEGIDLTCLTFPGLEIFYRFIHYREWDVSEMSFAKYVSFRSQGDASMIAIPVFPSRVFRAGSIWVAENGPTDPSDLEGARIGITEWAQTAGVYARGLLMDEFGFSLQSAQWFQAAAYQLGRAEKVELALPKGVDYSVVTDRTLDQMLHDGDLDVIISSEPPGGFADGSGRVRRLFSDPMSVDLAYWRKTGVVPIMHTVCLRSEIVERYPWVPMNLLTSFTEAKNRSVARLRSIRASRVPLPWAPYFANQVAELFPNDDFFPYGVDANRKTLETFLRYTMEQGVTHRQLEIDELFPKQVLTQEPETTNTPKSVRV